MDCNLIPGWDTNDCCPSCHYNADFGLDEPYGILLDGKKVIWVCFPAAKAYTGKTMFHIHSIPVNYSCGKSTDAPDIQLSLFEESK